MGLDIAEKGVVSNFSDFYNCSYRSFSALVLIKALYEVKVIVNLLYAW